MAPKTLSTPLLDADRERREGSYFAADLVFVNEAIIDEFSKKIPAELACFVREKSATLKSLGIELSLAQKSSPVKITLKVSDDKQMVQNPLQVRDGIVETLQELQEKFLCSFDGAPYLDPRIGQFWGADFEYPNVKLDAPTSPVGRRLILQHSQAVRRDVDRQVKHLDELATKVESYADLDPTIKEHQLKKLASLKNALLEQLASIESDQSYDLLEHLGVFDPLKYAIGTPDMIIDPENLSSNQGQEAKIGSDLDRLSPPRCRNHKEVLLHPVVLAAMKRMDRWEEDTVLGLSDILNDDESTTRLISEVQKILRKIYKSRPIEGEQIAFAIRSLVIGISRVRANSSRILDEKTLEKKVKKNISIGDSDYYDLSHSDLAQLPEICSYLVDLVANGASVDEILKVRKWDLENEMFIGKKIGGEVIKHLAFSEIWPEVGRIYQYSAGKYLSDDSQAVYKKSGHLHPLTTTIPGKSEILKVIEPFMSSEGKTKGFYSKSNSDGSKSIYARVQDEAGKEANICFHPDRFEPMIIDNQLVTRFDNYGVVKDLENADAEDMSFKIVSLADGTSFVQLEKDKKRYLLCIDSEPVTKFSNFNNSRNGAGELLRLVSTQQEKILVSADYNWRVGLPITVINPAWTNLSKKERKSSRKNFWSLEKRWSGSSAVYFRQDGGERIMLDEAVPTQLTWERVDENGKVVPGESLKNIKITGIYAD